MSDFASACSCLRIFSRFFITGATNFREKTTQRTTAVNTSKKQTRTILVTFIATVLSNSLFGCITARVYRALQIVTCFSTATKSVSPPSPVRLPFSFFGVSVPLGFREYPPRTPAQKTLSQSITPFSVVAENVQVNCSSLVG